MHQKLCKAQLLTHLSLKFEKPGFFSVLAIMLYVYILIQYMSSSIPMLFPLDVVAGLLRLLIFPPILLGIIQQLFLSIGDYYCFNAA